MLEVNRNWAARDGSNLVASGKVVLVDEDEPGDLIWFAAAPKDGDPGFEEFEVELKDAYLKKGVKIKQSNIQRR